MSDFTASNGVKVMIENGRVVTSLWPDGAESETVALREFFQYERDVEFGRTRDGVGDYAIYPHKGGQRIRIVNERDGKSWEYWRDFRSSPRNGPALIASTYFSSHPAPKPWHSAQRHEIWVLTTADNDERVWQITDRDDAFWALGCGYIRVDSPGIKAGRRIWPEAKP